jgi:hypothetical protein
VGRYNVSGKPMLTRNASWASNGTITSVRVMIISTLLAST